MSVGCSGTVPSDAQIEASIGGIWAKRDDRFSEIRTDATPDAAKVEMSYIGG